ncbi:MAG: GNAT family N-acetyltransferase [Rhodoferax sp.]|nr:GNAT family N-acetyltransferase [Rhodoferax sp.]
MLEEQILDVARHDRAGFVCGVPALDAYLAQLASQHVRKGVSAVYVLVDTEHPREVLGYYTLSAAELDATQLSAADRPHLPRYPVPCFRMGRLACRLDRRAQGLGGVLLGCAVARCLQARKQVTALALLVDAKDKQARAFYLHYGFTQCADLPMRLYLPLGAAS